MIELEHVSKTFGNSRAVDDISFQVKEGENLVLLGTSGCGKTTTLRMINRLIEPESGNITVNGENILTRQPDVLRRNIGYVLQHNGLFPHYTVAENIAIVPRLLKWDNKRIQERTAALMHKLHLPESSLNAYPRELSGGQQQRVNVARALAADPPVLLMDEPFGALDPITRTHIRREFSELEEFRKKTIVMVTHDVQEAFELGDRICLMDKGSIQQVGTPADLLFNPTNEYVKEFLSDQHFQLALKTIKPSDIWDKIPGESINDSVVPSLPALYSIWDIMEHANKEDQTLLTIQNADTGEIKRVRLYELLEGFSRYKHN